MSGVTRRRRGSLSPTPANHTMRNPFRRRSTTRSSAPRPAAAPQFLERLEPRVLMSATTFGIDNTTPDRFEGNGGNETSATATFVDFQVTFEGGIVRDLSIDDADDVDWFQLDFDHLGGFGGSFGTGNDIEIRTEGLQGLTMTLYEDPNQAPIAEGVGSSYGSTIDLDNANFHHFGRYHLKVSATGFETPTAYSLKIDGITSPTRDLDFNGSNDIVLRNEETGAVSLMLMDGATQVGTAALPTVSTQWDFAGVGQADGEYDADLIFHNASTGQTSAMLIRTGARVGWMALPTFDVGTTVEGIHDFNGDQTPDLLTRDNASGDLHIVRFDGSQIVEDHYLRTVTSDWVVGGVGSRNYNQTVDIAFHNNTTGQATYMQTSNMERTGWVALPRIGTEWTMSGMTSLNLDAHGRAEVLLHNATTADTTAMTLDHNGRTGWTGLPDVISPLVPHA